MAITADIKKTLAKSTAFYAVAGAGDLAVEKLREVPSHLQKVPSRLQKVQNAKIEPQALKDDAKQRLSGLQDGLAHLPERAQELAGTVAVQAGQTYGDLAVRGRQVVARMWGEAATQAAPEPVRTPVRRTAGATRKSPTRRTTRPATSSATGKPAAPAKGRTAGNGSSSGSA